MSFRPYFFLIFLAMGIALQLEQLVGSDGDFKIYQNNLRSYYDRGGGLSKDEWLKFHNGCDETWIKLRRGEYGNYGKVVENQRVQRKDKDEKSELRTLFWNYFSEYFDQNKNEQSFISQLKKILAEDSRIILWKEKDGTYPCDYIHKITPSVEKEFTSIAQEIHDFSIAWKLVRCESAEQVEQLYQNEKISQSPKYQTIFYDYCERFHVPQNKENEIDIKLQKFQGTGLEFLREVEQERSKISDESLDNIKALEKKFENCFWEGELAELLEVISKFEKKNFETVLSFVDYLLNYDVSTVTRIVIAQWREKNVGKRFLDKLQKIKKNEWKTVGNNKIMGGKSETFGSSYEYVRNLLDPKSFMQRDAIDSRIQDENHIQKGGLKVSSGDEKIFEKSGTEFLQRVIAEKQVIWSSKVSKNSNEETKWEKNISELHAKFGGLIWKGTLEELLQVIGKELKRGFITVSSFIEYMLKYDISDELRIAIVQWRDTYTNATFLEEVKDRTTVKEWNRMHSNWHDVAYFLQEHGFLSHRRDIENLKQDRKYVHKGDLSKKQQQEEKYKPRENYNNERGYKEHLVGDILEEVVEAVVNTQLSKKRNEKAQQSNQNNSEKKDIKPQTVIQQPVPEESSDKEPIIIEEKNIKLREINQLENQMEAQYKNNKGVVLTENSKSSGQTLYIKPLLYGLATLSAVALFRIAYIIYKKKNIKSLLYPIIT